MELAGDSTVEFNTNHLTTFSAGLFTPNIPSDFSYTYLIQSYPVDDFLVEILSEKRWTFDYFNLVLFDMLVFLSYKSKNFAVHADERKLLKKSEKKQLLDNFIRYSFKFSVLYLFLGKNLTYER